MKLGDEVTTDQRVGSVVTDRDSEIWERGPDGWYWLRLRFDPDTMEYGRGPTPIDLLLEHWGPLRYVGNPSDGKWGI